MSSDHKIKGSQTGDIHESHQPGDKAVSSPLEDVEESSKERCPEGEGNSPSFEKICDEDPGSCLVETVLLFQNEGAINL